MKKTSMFCGIFVLLASVALAQPGSGGLGLSSAITAGASGGRLTLTHTVSNSSLVVATNVWVTNQLPTGVSWLGTHISTRPPLSPLGEVHLRPAPIAANVTFAPPVSAGTAPAVAIAVVDLDLDGLPDVVVAHGTNANGFAIWRNTSGGLVDMSPPPSSFASGVRALTVGDFNGDGIPDIVAVGISGRDLTVWYEDGAHPDFHYAPGASLAFPTPITSVVACDFNGDGYSDLVALEPAAAVLHLLRSTASTGMPGFSEVGTLACPTNAGALLAARRDGPAAECANQRDLYVTSENSGGGVVSVFRHVCVNTDPPGPFYQARADYNCGPTPRDIAVADLDRDGLPDLAVANGPSGTITLLRADDDGSFELAGALQVSAPGTPGDVRSVRLFDLDGDGTPEVVTALNGQPACIVIPNSRVDGPLSEGQFGVILSNPMPGPVWGIGTDPCGNGPRVVVGGIGVLGPRPLAAGPSFSMLRLTQPGAEVAFALGDIPGGQVISADLELEVGMSGATNSASVASLTDGAEFAKAGFTGLNAPVGGPLNILLPQANVCGRIFCVSDGKMRPMPGVSITLSLAPWWFPISVTGQTLSNGRFCVPFPFACGLYPAGATITVSSPACRACSDCAWGQSWTFPASILYGSLTLPTLYCSNCAPCVDPASAFTIYSGRGAGAVYPDGTIDPQFTVSGPAIPTSSSIVDASASWFANDAVSKWVSPPFTNAPPLNLPVRPIGAYAFETRFQMSCLNEAELGGRWAADDTGTIYLNNKPTGISLPTGLSFEGWHPFSITSGILPGWNTLTFWITNTVNNTPAGLRVEMFGASSGDCCGGSCLEIFCPSPITVTTCSNCAPADFGPRAENPCCPKTSIICFPPAGSLFPIGTTTVTCTASDTCGGRQACSFPVTVRQRTNCCQPPAIAAQPQDVTIPQKGTAVLNVGATGTAPLSYQWRRDGTNLVSKTNLSLTYTNIQRPQTGRYSVCVSNACGVATSLVAQILVSRPAAADVVLTVDEAPYVQVGNNFMCHFTLQNIGNAAASGLVLTGYWASAQIGLVSASPGCVFSFPANALSMTCNVGALPVGGITNYYIMLSDSGVGSVALSASVSGDPSEINLANNTAAAATSFGFPPGFSVQPVSFFGAVAGAGSFSLTATGTPVLAYFWQHNGSDVGPNGPALGFTEIHSSDSGPYVCIVSNQWGQATSAPVTLSLSYPASPTAAIDGSQTLRVVGSSGTDDIEIRLKAGDPTRLEIDNLANGVGVDFTFLVSAFNRLVVELGDQNNKLVFNDANGRVTALPIPFEIHGGAGSNLVVGSSTGINLNQLPGLINTLNARPNFEALAAGLYDQATTNILNPSLDMVGRLYTNMVLTAQMLVAMAQTNIVPQASNLVSQAQALSQAASNCVNQALCQFANSSLPNAVSCQQFTNCLLQLIDQLEALEDTMTNTVDGLPLNPLETQAEALSDQMEQLIEAHEEAAELFELGMDGVYDSGADAFYAKVAGAVENPGVGLGEFTGPNFEALAGQFEALAGQLLEMQAGMFEAEADMMSNSAVNLEAAANAIALQATTLEAAIAAFTAVADPPPVVNPNFVGNAATPVGTNAGCDRNIRGQSLITFKVGGIIIGTPTNDIIFARPNTWLILGLGGNDLIFGSTNTDIISGGSGDDEIHGRGGNDLLFGNLGNDCIFGDEGFDLIVGGDGDDNLHGGTNIDLIIGGNGNDKMFGDENADIMIGGPGDDEMDGGDGIDLMFGGPGNDIMHGGPGFKITNNIPFVCHFEIGNLMFGGDGDDTIYGGDGVDVIFGGAGNDTIYSSNQVDVIFGGDGDDKIYGGDGGALFYVIPSPGVTNGIQLGNVIFGGPGDDIIEGGKDIDVLFGGSGNDNIRGSYSYDAWDYPPISFDCGVAAIGLDMDIIFGGPGDDTLDGGYDTDLIFGGPGNDTILGNGEPDRLVIPELGLLFGGPDNDTIIGGPYDAITLAFGGPGDDTIRGSTFGVMNLLFGGPDNDTIEGNGDLITLAFGGPGDDTVNGGGFVLDLLFGGPGNDRMDGKLGVLDVMFGNGGDDMMQGGTGVLNLMFGGPGNDTMRSGFALVGVMFGNSGCDTMYNQSLVGLDFGNADQDIMIGGPSLVEILFGNDGDDFVQGGGLFDILFGNAGNDTVRGGPVFNFMFGNSGNDTMYGGDGFNMMFGNAGNDRMFGGDGPDIIFGGKDDDCIDGHGGPDLIFGGLGNDFLMGGDGIDLIFGGPGDDFIYGGSDANLLFGGRGSGSDTILGGPFKDIIFGQKGNDYLDGGGEKDRIWGGQGDDYITGRGDNSRLRGNRGNDQFLVVNATVRIHGGQGTDIYYVASGSVSHLTSASPSGSALSFNTPQPMCSEIHGTKWRDDNGNGVRDPGEPGMAGVQLYLDLDNDGMYDPGEPSTVTMADDPTTKADETGMYWFTGLKPGTYHVREFQYPTWVQTYPPANGAHDLTVGLLDVVTGQDFGNKPVCVPPPSGMVLWLPLDETTNTVAYNRVGGPNGLHVGNPAPTSGLVISSRCYGDGQYTTVPHHGLIDITTNDFSIDAWIKRGAAVLDNVEGIVDKRVIDGTGVRGYFLFLLDGRLWCQLADGPYGNYDSGMAVPADGQWHFVALTVQRKTGGRFWVDGFFSQFNPTAHTGSLANNGALIVGANQPGCLDEVEVFNRALTSTDIGRIFGAGALGKCKVSATLKSKVTMVCSNASSVLVTIGICNNGASADTFSYSFAALNPPGSVAGPTSFFPASGSGLLQPGSCVSIPVMITRPASMTGNTLTNQVAYYQMVVNGQFGGQVAAVIGKLTRAPGELCIAFPSLVVPGPAVPVYITRDGLSVTGGDKVANVPVTFRNDGTAPMEFTARFSFIVNDAPPEPAYTTEITLAPGASTVVPLSASFTDDDPAALYTILIEADLDGDGQFEPLSSFAIQEVIQGEMRIDLQPFQQSGLPPLLRPSISWSGFGTLESAPFLPASSVLPGHWSPVPGNPGSPLVLTNSLDAIQFFRLRQ